MKKIIRKIIFLSTRLKRKSLIILWNFIYENINIGSNFNFGSNIKFFEYSTFKLTIGNNVILRGYANFIFFDEDPILTIGNNCFFNLNCSISTGNGKISIGNNCLFGENVKIYNHNHRFSRENILISQQGYSYCDILIGCNVWIGSNVLILKGALIGDNCVIAAGSIVKQNIPSNSIYVDGIIKSIVYR